MNQPGVHVSRGPGAVEIFASPEDLARAALQTEVDAIRRRLDTLETMKGVSEDGPHRLSAPPVMVEGKRYDAVSERPALDEVLRRLDALEAENRSLREEIRRLDGRTFMSQRLG